MNKNSIGDMDMAKSKRIQWADIYQCEMTAQAQLIASILNANGLLAKIQRKKTSNSKQSVPFVRVMKTQQQHAISLMSQYNIHD